MEVEKVEEVCGDGWFGDERIRVKVEYKNVEIKVKDIV